VVGQNSNPASAGAFFGRRKGRPLRELQSTSYGAGLSLYGIDLTKPAPVDVGELFPTGVRAIRLEIGFGGGEHLLYRAAEDPEIGLIGVEPFINGLAKVTAALRVRPMPNLRLFQEDAIMLLDWLPEGSLDGIDLFYPDPWPKKRHWKRRFVNPSNLDRFARVLKSGGLFRFASDIDTYVNWTLRHCRAHADFEWQALVSADWTRPYPGWPGTRYEAKALREGRKPAYLSFLRR
jgi:tRNA (guanine-N7-)-methyltransferase